MGAIYDNYCANDVLDAVGLSPASRVAALERQVAKVDRYIVHDMPRRYVRAIRIDRGFPVTPDNEGVINVWTCNGDAGDADVSLDVEGDNNHSIRLCVDGGDLTRWLQTFWCQCLRE